MCVNMCVFKKKVEGLVCKLFIHETKERGYYTDRVSLFFSKLLLNSTPVDCFVTTVALM